MKKITEREVLQKLKKIMDPELGCNIVDLGLIYKVEVRDNNVNIKMTLTFSGCPMGTIMVSQVEEEIRKMAGVGKVRVGLVFKPAWSPEKMVPRLRSSLNF